MGKPPDYRVVYCVPGTSRWVSIGSGWKNKKDDNIGIVLDALPIGFDGKLLIAINEYKNEPKKPFKRPTKGKTSEESVEEGIPVGSEQEVPDVPSGVP